MLPHATRSAPLGEPRGRRQPARRKLVDTSLSDSGEHILVHFVSTQDQMVTVQLEIAFATRFHQNLALLWQNWS